LAGAKDGIIRFYPDGSKLQNRVTEFKSHTGTVNMLSTTAASNMEDIFASVSADKSMRIWDTRQKNPTLIERTKEEILFC